MAGLLYATAFHHALTARVHVAQVAAECMRAREILLDAKAVGEVGARSQIVEPLHLANHQWINTENLLREFPRDLHQLVVRNHAIDEAPLLSFLRAEIVAGQRKLARLANA